MQQGAEKQLHIIINPISHNIKFCDIYTLLDTQLTL
jgi:hypothetical protein